jgi:transposase
MDILYPNSAGGDVHQKSVVVCAQWHDGERHRKETRTYATTTGELLKLADWLDSLGITHLAVESTGVYWKPVYWVLESHLEVWLVNAQHVKKVPGRKTDVSDAEWLASLLKHGLVRPSFVPPKPQRELRDLTRQRANLVRDRTQVLNRLQKVLEDANVKLASVVSDVNGVSALAMLRELVAGHTTPKTLAALARGTLRKKSAELDAALTGRFNAHHRFLLMHALMQLTFWMTNSPPLLPKLNRGSQPNVQARPRRPISGQ